MVWCDGGGGAGTRYRGVPHAVPWPAGLHPPDREGRGPQGAVPRPLGHAAARDPGYCRVFRRVRVCDSGTAVVTIGGRLVVHAAVAWPGAATAGPVSLHVSFVHLCALALRPHACVNAVCGCCRDGGPVPVCGCVFTYASLCLPPAPVVLLSMTSRCQRRTSQRKRRRRFRSWWGARWVAWRTGSRFTPRTQ